MSSFTVRPFEDQVRDRELFAERAPRSLRIAERSDGGLEFQLDVTAATDERVHISLSWDRESHDAITGTTEADVSSKESDGGQAFGCFKKKSVEQVAL